MMRRVNYYFKNLVDDFWEEGSKDGTLPSSYYPEQKNLLSQILKVIAGYLYPPGYVSYPCG